MSLFSRARGWVRVFWRDLVMGSSVAAAGLDDRLTARFFKDSGYQWRWSQLAVHKTLLADEVRTEAFKKAINEVVGEGDTVLDVGTGTGILAFFAREAGASKVYAVDYSNIVDKARKIAQENRIDGIEFIRSDIRDLDVPKVDVIISELIGMHVIDEDFIGKLRKAKKFLKEGGKVMPAGIEIFAAPVETSDVGVGFWRKLYGVDYTPIEADIKDMQNFVATSKTKRLARDALAYRIDSRKLPSKKIEVEKKFTVDKAGELHGFMLYFKAKLSETVTLSTSPESAKTHWKQTFLPLGSRAPVKKGDKVKLKLWAIDKNQTWRFKITLED